MLIEKGLVKNCHNIKARGLKGALLTILGREDEAKSYLHENLDVDAFDFVSRWLLYKLDDSCKESVITGDIENFLQTARDFAEFGMYEYAAEVLAECRQESPLKYYYRAYYLYMLGE